MYRNTSGGSRIPRDGEAPASESDGRYGQKTSILETYLDQIGRIPLLNPQQEQALGYSIQRCNSRLETLRSNAENRRKFTHGADFGAPESDTEIVQMEEALQQAICELVEHNLRLVVREACRYRQQRDSLLLDLIQEGNLGLLRAARKFDPGRGGRFSTYATYWIRLFIDRAARRISTLLAMSLEEAGRQRYGRHTVQILSLDAPQVPDDLTGFLRTEETPWASLDQEWLAEQLKRGLSTLNQREAEILKLRFGLEGNESQTLQHIADRLGVTRERVRQIEKAALGKLRRKFHEQWQSLLP